MDVDYKSCPLKKRPIVYVKDERKYPAHYDKYNYEHEEALDLIKTSAVSDHDEKPQDLSMKGTTSDNLGNSVVKAKSEYVLNLSNKSSPISFSQTPVQYSSDKLTEKYSPPCELGSNHNQYQPKDIHLRGMTPASCAYTTNPYKSAFVTAVGGNSVSMIWNTYQPNAAAIFPSPSPSSASAASSNSANNYHHITPPSSPDSEINSEPEDLSMGSDIPLPALYHTFNTTPSHKFGNAVYSKHNSSSSVIPQNYRFKCDKCNKIYSTPMGLSKHEQFHCPAAACNQEKKQHACQDCGKMYTTTGALKMHIRTHTLPCKCPICGKAFSRPWLLQGHIRTHTGEKPFQCHDCLRSFADRSNLRAHQQTHAEVKKYACKVCFKSFSRMSLLNKHVLSSCTITIV